ncbi:MAG: carbohydrate kinase family protein [Anaerolineae bacterium]|nr:carbohydrate kinase family protein [Anaerolineae bacterium]
MQKSTVVAGHICLDVIPDLDALPKGQFHDLFKPGHLIVVGEAVFATGGPVSNTGLALHRLGVPTQLIAKIGDDPFGEIVTGLVGSIDRSLVGGLVVDPGVPTSYTVIISAPDVDRIFLHNPGANDAFSADDVDYSLLDAADLFHFGYPPIMAGMVKNEGDELAAIFRQAKQTDVTTSLDMAFPDPTSPGGRADWQAILDKTLPHVDIFTPSVEEILFLLHRDRYNRLIDEHGSILAALSTELLNEISGNLLAMGTKIVLLKLGDRGAYLRTGDASTLIDMGRGTPDDLAQWADRELWAPCFQVDVVGTTGSGDATIAGFLSAFLRGYDPAEALTMAVAVGACNVEAADAISGLRSWEETRSRIEQGWLRCSFELDAEGWSFDARAGLWIGR